MDTKKTPEANEQSTGASRREFLTPVAAGAATAAFLSSSELLAAEGIPTIKIPKEITESLNEPVKIASFGNGNAVLGAQVFANACKAENLAALFCAPGNYDIINAIAATGIPSYGGRSEGSMASAADGFYRVTGEVTACSGTEGPGFTNMIMNIAVAHRARTPLLVLASNINLAADDRETFIQTGYQQPTTEGMKKYGKRLIDPSRVHEYAGYAFRELKTGVPGPVHLDFPSEVYRARFTEPAQLKDYFDKDRYRTESRPYPSPRDMERVIDMMNRAERPVLVAGHGVFHRKAWEALQKAAEKNELAVAPSGPMRGHFPDEHRLCTSLSVDALANADLEVFVGQYSMPSKNEYKINANAKAIRVNPIPDDLGRNWPLDVGIVADEAAFLELLADGIPRRKRDTWVAEIAAARKKFEEKLQDNYALGVQHSKATGTLHQEVIGKEVHDFLYKGDIDPKQTVTLWGGWTIGNAAARWLRAYRPGQEVNVPYQYMAIGPDVAMAVGAGAAVQLGVGPQAPYKGAPVVVVTSDAGMAYSLLELDTAAKYKIPIICVVFNNDCWGMWPSATNQPRAMHMYLFQQNLRYDKMAEGLGAAGEYVHTQEEFRQALRRAYKTASANRLSTLINVQGMREFTSAALYPPGNYVNPEPSIGGLAH